MALALTIAYVVHVVMAALWTGSVLFVTYAVLPPGYSGEVGPAALEAAVSKLSVITRTAALVLPATGLYQVFRLYPGDALVHPPRGHLVLGMILLWAVVTALVEVAGSRMRDGLAEGKVRTPARAGRPFMLAASALSVLLLVDAGLLASGFGA